MPGTVELDPNAVNAIELDPGTVKAVSLDPAAVRSVRAEDLPRREQFEQSHKQYVAETLANPPAYPSAPKPGPLQTDQEFAADLAVPPKGMEKEWARQSGRELAGADLGPTLRGGATAVQGGREMVTAPTMRGKAAGLHKAIGGVFEAALPAVAAGAVAAPVGTALGVGTFSAVSSGTEAILDQLGLPLEYAQVAGDLAGIGGSGAILKGLGTAVGRAYWKARVKNFLQEKLNAEYAAKQAAEKAARQPKQVEAAPEAVKPGKPADPVMDAEFEPVGPQKPPSPAGAVAQSVGGAVAKRNPDARLPRDLAGAKPRYNHGAKPFTLVFESDMDRAAFIAAQPNPSKQDARYVQFVADNLGMSEAEVRNYGQHVRTRIRLMARDEKPGELVVRRSVGDDPARQQGLVELDAADVTPVEGSNGRVAPEVRVESAPERVAAPGVAPAVGAAEGGAGQTDSAVQVKRTREALADGRIRHTLLVKPDGQGPIGELSLIDAGDVLRVDQARVDKGQRGKGYGKALYRDALDLAAAEGKSGIESAFSVSDDAAHVWRSMGAEEFGPNGLRRFRLSKPRTEKPSGRETSIAVPGEQTRYPARYAVRELDQVQASHNAFNFEPNPLYRHQNDRDYSRTGAAARVAKQSAPGTFDPEFLVSESPTAERGAPIIDATGNVLGGNSRTMTLARVYQRGGADAAAYRQAIEKRAESLGIDPAQLAGMKRPVLVREVAGEIGDVQRAITDFNKAAAAQLTPEERAVSDGRRLSTRTLEELAGRLEELGEDGTLAGAIAGRDGASMVNLLVRDGLMTPQEAAGYVDERQHLTMEGKARIAKALVGRLFNSPSEFRDTTPEMRGKLERIAPHVLRVEGRPEWSITERLREAVALIEDARAHKMSVVDAAAQSVIGKSRSYSLESIAIAQTLQQGPLKAAAAVRRYANDEALSRDGAQAAFFDPPTRAEAFRDAFTQGERGASVEYSRPLKPSAADRPARTESERLQYWAKADADLPGRGHVYLNNAASDLLDSAIATITGGAATGWDGLTLEPSDVKLLADTLEGSPAYPPDVAAAMRTVAASIRRAAQKDPYVVVVRNESADRGTDVSRKARLNAIYHEAFERSIKKLRGGSEDPIVSEALMDDPVAQRAWEVLGGAYSAKDGNPDAQAVEIAAHIAGGNWHELGLGREEAFAWFARFLSDLEARHPGATVSTVARIHPELRRSVGEQTRESAQRAAAQRRELGRSAEGAETRNHQAPQRRPDGRGVKPEYAKQLGSPGGGLRSRRGTGTSQEVRLDLSPELPGIREETGKLDPYRQKLEADRLTAQFNAPVSREEQLRRMRRKQLEQQTSMFEETPEEPQGGLFGNDTPAIRQGGLFGDETGAAPMLSDFAGYLQKRFGREQAGEANYSGLGARESKYVRNLGQISRASEPARAAAVRAGSSAAQANIMIQTAAPKIEEALGKDGPTFKEFRTALIESRLQGIRERWGDMARQAGRQTDQQLQQSLERGLLDILGAIDHDQWWKPSPDAAQVAVAKAEQGDWDGLRQMLQGTFTEASSGVAQVLSPDDFSRITEHEGFQRALPVYRKLLEKPMAESHAINEGVFSTALGPLQAYYPLIPLTGSDRAAFLSGSKVPYKKPKNAQNEFATGLADTYDAEMEPLKKRLQQATRDNNKAAMLQVLEEEGILQPLKPGRPAPAVITYQGREFTADVVEVGKDKVVIEGGKAVHVPAKKAIIPAWAKKELEPILEKSAPDLEDPKLLNLVTRIQMSGPVDFVFHSANVMGALIANTPFIPTKLGLVGNIAGNLPFTKRFTAIARMAAVDPMSEASAEKLQHMARIGALPSRFGSETYSKKYAEQTGAEVRWTLGPTLFGPKGIDVRARLVMYDVAKELNPDISDKDLTAMLNQLGNYTRDLQGTIERAVKASGWSSFYTAGSTMMRNGINAWTGAGPMPKDGASMRIYQMLTGGAVGVVALWVATYKAYTGQWPWEDRRMKFLQIPVDRSARRSKLGRALWGDGPETGYINFGFASPIVARGARALGIAGAADTLAAGGSAGQAVEAGFAGTLNAIAHPFLGPPAKVASAAVLGVDPYMTGLRDGYGRFGPQFGISPIKKQPYGLPTLKARAVGGLYALNPFYGNLAAATGFAPSELNEEHKGNQWLRMAVDMSFPQLVGRPSNPYKRAAFLQRQRKAAAKGQ